MSDTPYKFKLGDIVWTQIAKSNGVKPSLTQTTIAGVTIQPGAKTLYSLNLVINGGTVNRTEDQLWATLDEATVATVMGN